MWAAIVDVADRDWVDTGVILGITLVVAIGLDRWIVRRARRLAVRMSRGELSPEVDTRLRFARRFLEAAVILIGVTLAFGLGEVAGSVLASGAIGAAIIGFAARQTLANVVAGIMLAITQPLRVGDWVHFEDLYGVVEDVRLSYTVLVTAGAQRILIPNERLAAGVLRNDTLGAQAIGLDVSVWIPPDADVTRALSVLADATGASVAVSEATTGGIRITVGGDPVAPSERARCEAALRRRALEVLHSEGLLAGFGAPQANG